MKMILDDKEIVTVHCDVGDSMIHIQEHNCLISAHRLRPCVIVEIQKNGMGKEVNPLRFKKPELPDNIEDAAIWNYHNNTLPKWQETESKLRELPVTSKEIGAYVSKGGKFDVWVAAETHSTWYAYIRTVDDIDVKAFELFCRTTETKPLPVMSGNILL